MNHKDYFFVLDTRKNSSFMAINL